MPKHSARKVGHSSSRGKMDRFTGKWKHSLTLSFVSNQSVPTATQILIWMPIWVGLKPSAQSSSQSLSEDSVCGSLKQLKAVSTEIVTLVLCTFLLEDLYLATNKFPKDCLNKTAFAFWQKDKRKGIPQPGRASLAYFWEAPLSMIRLACQNISTCQQIALSVSTQSQPSVWMFMP